MSEPEEVLNELRRQSSLLEAIEKRQGETNKYLKGIGILVAVAIATITMAFLRTLG